VGRWDVDGARGSNDATNNKKENMILVCIFSKLIHGGKNAGNKPGFVFLMETTITIITIIKNGDMVEKNMKARRGM